MAEFRVLVTGSRSWRQPAVIRRVLEAAWTLAHDPDGRPPRMVVVHGGASGADRLAGAYATSRGWDVEVHHADWSGPCEPERPKGHRRVNGRGEYCPHAGHRRNATMVSLGAALVLAFWRDHSSGTDHCLKAARAAGLTVDVHHDCVCHPVGQPALFT